MLTLTLGIGWLEHKILSACPIILRFAVSETVKQTIQTVLLIYVYFYISECYLHKLVSFGYPLSDFSQKFFVYILLFAVRNH